MNRIAVLGLGRVGTLAAELLQDIDFDVVGIDQKLPRRLNVAGRSADLADPSGLVEALADVDAVLSCLPYQLNMRVADAAHELGVHYFDLTEDVPTTAHIRQLAESASSLFAPQCGLAPGLVGIVAGDLIGKVDDCRAVKMRVGALPQHPDGQLGYAFNWSPSGVVNEYLNDCEVIEDGVRKIVSSMEWHEPVYIDGVRLEAFTTSGGLGTMCETYLGQVANLDYKTLRYPGHVDLMNFFFHELLMRERRDLAGEILTRAKPPVSDDVVFVHVSVVGTIDEAPMRSEFVRRYLPRVLVGAERTAIAWTTAASAVGVVELARSGALPERGFLKQEDIPLPALLATKTGQLFAD